jgi:ketosteroid isomerase-like protein
MPPADVEAAKRIYEAIESRDSDAWERILDPNVEWIVPPSLPWGGTRRGIEEVREFAAEMGEHVRSGKVETDEFIDVGDGELIVLGRFRAEATVTGAPIEAEFAHHIKVSDGKVVRFQNYIDSGSILRAIAEPPTD